MTIEATLFWIIMAAVAAMLVMTIRYSYKSRTNPDGRLRGLYASRMNIVMGVMLILLATLQILFPGSTLRVIIGAIFMLLGVFNLFAGLRNHRYFSSLSQ